MKVKLIGLVLSFLIATAIGFAAGSVGFIVSLNAAQHTVTTQEQNAISKELADMRAKLTIPASVSEATEFNSTPTHEVDAKVTVVDTKGRATNFKVIFYSDPKGHISVLRSEPIND